MSNSIILNYRYHILILISKKLSRFETECVQIGFLRKPSDFDIALLCGDNAFFCDVIALLCDNIALFCEGIAL